MYLEMNFLKAGAEKSLVSRGVLSSLAIIGVVWAMSAPVATLYFLAIVSISASMICLMAADEMKSSS